MKGLWYVKWWQKGHAKGCACWTNILWWCGRSTYQSFLLIKGNGPVSDCLDMYICNHILVCTCRSLNGSPATKKCCQMLALIFFVVMANSDDNDTFYQTMCRNRANKIIIFKWNISFLLQSSIFVPPYTVGSKPVLYLANMKLLSFNWLLVTSIFSTASFSVGTNLMEAGML